MGSEQSNLSDGQVVKDERSSKTSKFRRGQSVPEQKRIEPNLEASRPGSCSPGLSVCSDSEIPYIPYTVVRPIGESPKFGAKHLGRSKTLGVAGGILSAQQKKISLRKQQPIRQSTHNIVVVKAAAKNDSSTDPEIERLQNLPTFVPIMKGTMNHPNHRDPEVLEGLSGSSLHKLCLRFQTHLAECSSHVTESQQFIIEDVKQISQKVSHMKSDYNDSFKSFKENVEQLQKAGELTSQVAKCHLLLNKALESIEKLNNLLPPDDRLEPFVWTTG